VDPLSDRAVPTDLARSQSVGPWREALRLSWPATLSLLLHSGYRINDQYWIGPLGADAQAALGITTFQLILNFAMIVLIQSGTLARIARHTGARDFAARSMVYNTMLRMGISWFAVVAVIGWLTAPAAVVLLGAEGTVRDLSIAYLVPIYLGLPLMALKPFTDGVFLGLGNTFTPMLLAGFSVLLNFVLNPMLIFGYAGFPEMGIAGAAWATVIARGTAGLIGIFLLARNHGLIPRRHALSWPEFRQVLRIGMPVSLNNAAYALTFIAVLKTSVAPFGRTVQAGLGVAFNGIEAISYCGLMGPAIACSSIVGRRLGAGDPDGARQAVFACTSMSVAIATVATLLFAIWPEHLVSVFSDDPAVLAQAALYLWTVSWSQTATAADSTLQQALAGAGHSFRMSITTTTGLLLRIPLAWALAHSMDWGPSGIWWAFNFTNWLKLIAIVLVFRSAAIWRTQTSPIPAPPLPKSNP
jgi:MATE family, multidrug efflux pump